MVEDACLCVQGACMTETVLLYRHRSHANSRKYSRSSMTCASYE